MTRIARHPGLIQLLAAVREFQYNIPAYQALGDIYAARQGDLLLFNYTIHAAIAARWNDVERICRGLIVHVPTATVAALPFEKFFNLNETPQTRLEALPPGPVEVTSKFDGSLGILYRAPDGPAVATRGSFGGVQAVWATAHLRTRYDLTDLPADVTLLFEIIYPENRIVLDYGDMEALVLIGARRLDGYDYPHADLAAIATHYGFPLVALEPAASVHDLLPLLAESRGVEGWVVRFPGGLRVKVKTADYLRLHRLRSNLTPGAVRAALLADGWEAFLVGLPDEFHREVTALAGAMRARVDAEEIRLRAIFAAVQAAVSDPSRKAFAIAVQTHYAAESPYLFALLDGRDVRALILQKLDL